MQAVLVWRSHDGMATTDFEETRVLRGFIQAIRVRWLDLAVNMKSHKK